MLTRSNTKGQQHTILQKLKNFYHLGFAMWYAAKSGFPGRKLTMIGVTGTDGKTSTTYMIYHVLREAGVKVALINTIEAIIGDHTIETGLHVTTQDPKELQPLLKKVLLKGFEAVVLETTSHGLEQHRVWGIDFDIAVVTNIKEDHLDYHGSREEYMKAKGKLFDNLAHGKKKKITKTAILNKTDDSFNFLDSKPCTSKITYNSPSSKAPTQIRVSNIKQTLQGLQFDVYYNTKLYPAFLPLLGTYNADNAQATIAVGLACGLTIENILRYLTKLPQIKGRMQKIEKGQSFTAFVDFAHTPAALEKALQSLRPLTKKRLIVVFGCAGERDKNRRKMGKVAAKLADVGIFTNEDHRSEDIHKVLKEITAYAEQGGARRADVNNPEKIENYPVYFLIPDRKEAIEFAIKIAQTGDIVDFTGKGHEQSLNVDNNEIPWDEPDIVSAALINRKNFKNN